MSMIFAKRARGLGLAAALAALSAPPAAADSLLRGFKRISTVASTITDNGDLNPYAVFVAPTSSGKIKKGDVIVDNFNNVSNLQGTGGTIVAVNPKRARSNCSPSCRRACPNAPAASG